MTSSALKSVSPAPAHLKTIIELVAERNLTVTDIVGRLGLNQRTVKHRLELPWLFNIIELGRLAKLLEYDAGGLCQLVLALAASYDLLNPDKLPKGRRAGRPRREVAGPVPE